MTETRQTLLKEVVQLVVDAVNLRGISVDDVTENTPIIGEGLGLDSVDILEVLVNIEQKYDVKIKSADEGQKIFHSVGSVVDYLIENSPKLQMVATESSRTDQPTL